MTLTIENATRLKTGCANEILFNINEDYIPLYKKLLMAEKDQTYKVTLDNTKHRTTGELSQNHHINGHCQQIAIETGNDFDDVKAGAKWRAIKRGYPVSVDISGRVYPKSETKLNTIEAGHFIEELHQIAAELDIKLIEDNK